MGKRYDDDDLDYKNIRPGEIDKTIFESDDDDYEIDENKSNELDEILDENTSDNNFEDYDMENATIKELIENEKEENLDDGTETDTEPIVEKFDSVDELNEEDKTIEEIIEETENTTDESVLEKIEKTEEKIKSEKENTEVSNDTNIPEEALVKKEDDTESDAEFRNDMVNRFKAACKDIYTRYKESDLVTYINDFIDVGNNRKEFSDTFIMNYCKFSLAIDFSNELALRDLYVLVAGLFADEIENRKKANQIESYVDSSSVNNDPNDVNIVEDENIRSVKEYMKSQQEKYSQYKLDRTVFDICDSTDEENSSIFDDKRTFDRDFYESPFFSIHKEVLISDRSADMSKVYSKIIIREESSYIPVIDYSTGVRVICIDTDDTDQYRLNPLMISRKVPFSFNGFNNRTIKVRVLYLDDVKARPVSVIASLKKLIGFKYYKQKYKIKLNGNYVIAYTTEPRYVDMFEKGDPDSRKPENSSMAMSKPSNMTIGIIVLDRKTINDKRSIRRNQIMRDLGKYEAPSTDDYNIQFVLSARIVKNDMRLRNPAIPRQERYVEYSILQYNECNSVIILDGLETIIACIIKEHKATYSPGTPYSITFEYDRDGLTSPAVIAMLDERDGLEPALNQRNNPNEMDSMFILPPSRRKMDGVYDFEIGRIDKRYLSPVSIQRKYDKSLWANYDLSIRDGRLQFIRSRGFEEFLKNKPITFDVMPYALNMIETSDAIRDIIKVSLTMLSDKNSQDTEAILFKQAELNYKKSLGDSKASKFQLFLLEAANFIIDSIASKNNPTNLN